MNTLRFALALAMTIALAPFALDSYLPAFPQMAASLHINEHQLSLTISVYIFTLALGQLVGGPLADQFGRQRVMFVGLCVFCLTTLLITFTQHFYLILVLRACQAFGGGWTLVCIPALVRDRVHGREAAKLFSLIGLIAIVAPGIAPSLGTLLMNLGNWRTIFVFVTLYSLLVMFILHRFVFTLEDASWNINRNRTHALKRYAAVLRTTPALRYIGMQTMSFSVMILFITHSSFIYQQHFQVGPNTFALLFAGNIAVMLVMNLLNRWLLNYFDAHRILWAGLLMQGGGLTALLLATITDAGLPFFVPALMITIGAMGAISPNNQACCMEFFPQNAGTAAALMGAVQFSVAGLISALSSLLPESVSAIVLAQCVCTMLSLLLVLLPGARHP